MLDMGNDSYKRLREVMAKLGIEMSDAELARKFNLLDQHINHWKNRGVPKDILIDLADEWHFRTKYVRDGEGEMFDSYVLNKNSPEAKVITAMQSMDPITKYQAVKILNTLAEPKKEGNGKEK
jgi:hypothetical protein